MLRLALALLLALALPAQAEIRVRDDLGQELVLDQPARRIISLAPHATEVLFAAGAGARVVGVVSHSDYPPEAGRLPRVGGYHALDYEAILALRPDLVVAWQSGNGPATVTRLRDMGLSVYVSEPRTLEDVARNLERLGRLAGSAEDGDKAAAAFRAGRDRLRERYRDRPPVTVFYQIWNRPLMTLNGQHLVSQVIRLCGGVNVFADLPALAPTVDTEAVLASDPQVIVASGMAEERPEWLDGWRRWPGLRAVRNGQLHVIPPAIMQRHGPRILQGAERLCGILEQARRSEEQP